MSTTCTQIFFLSKDLTKSCPRSKSTWIKFLFINTFHDVLFSISPHSIETIQYQSCPQFGLIRFQKRNLSLDWSIRGAREHCEYIKSIWFARTHEKWININSFEKFNLIKALVFAANQRWNHIATQKTKSKNARSYPDELTSIYCKNWWFQTIMTYLPYLRQTSFLTFD